jgi:hypothetical protein
VWRTVECSLSRVSAYDVRLYLLRLAYSIPECSTIFQGCLHWLDRLVVGNAAEKGEGWCKRFVSKLELFLRLSCRLTHEAIAYGAHRLPSDSLRGGQARHCGRRLGNLGFCLGGGFD